MNSKYLNEILSSEGSDLPNISSKILDLVHQANALKTDVKTVVEDGSFKFNPFLKENDRLISEAKNLSNEMTLIEEKIDKQISGELSSCSDELQSLSSSLKEINLFLNILRQLVKINLKLNQAREMLMKNEFLECSQLVVEVQIMMKKTSEKFKKIELFKVLSQEAVLMYEQLIHQMSETWAKCISINSENDPLKNLDLVSLSINLEFQNEAAQILKASNLLNLTFIETKFSKNLLHNILNRVVINKSELNATVQNGLAILNIELENSDKKPNYLDVFSKIKTIVNFIKSYLNVEVENNVSFLDKIGNFITADFVDNLIKNCLSETIPTSSEDLDKYKDVVENAKALEKSLQDAGFMPLNSNSLLDYAKNINVLFANKFCQSYLQKARTIMKKDLHDVVKSEDVISNISVLPTPHRNILENEMNIHNEIFLFPKCQISKQAYEIMSLVQSMMKEIEKSLDLCAVRLFYTIRNIFEMYSAIVPLHHKKFLETLPHQVAIFHNNCMYFAHNLINLVVEYYNKIPHILKDHFTVFLEEAVVLRSLAVKTLEVTVTNQCNQLIYILRDSGFTMLNDNSTLDPNSERSIRQCVRQLQILQKVWMDVLPLTVYNRAIGFLLDSIIEELITLIISVEDISSQTASDLESSFNIILEKGANLFLDSKEVHRHARKWQKFKEFVYVLKGTLRDIDDRWANGMGPLAVEFTPEQIKHLIRALFQNSDRRAALLARIR